MAFVESYLIIYDIFPSDYIDFIYVLTCFILELFNSYNEIVYKETLKLFCKKKYILIYGDINSNEIQLVSAQGSGEKGVILKSCRTESLANKKTEKWEY